MLSNYLYKKSKFLSLILRHKPEKAGLVLDEGGWVEVPHILHALKITTSELKLIVENNNKNRFAFNNDYTKIRANQGHSIPVDLGLIRKTPPVELYHGTVDSLITNILAGGLQKMKRNHVHLSSDIPTAMEVAKRRRQDNPCILTIQAGKMHEDGLCFYLSKNGVWLTDEVLPVYISYVDRHSGE